MSIQYTALGFEHTTFRTRVSSHNHQTRIFNNEIFVIAANYCNIFVGVQIFLHSWVANAPGPAPAFVCLWVTSNPVWLISHQAFDQALQPDQINNVALVNGLAIGRALKLLIQKLLGIAQGQIDRFTNVEPEIPFNEI